MQLDLFGWTDQVSKLINLSFQIYFHLNISVNFLNTTLVFMD